MTGKDTVCELCRTAWSFAGYHDTIMLAECGHENWFLSGYCCGACSRKHNRCQCCGKELPQR